MIRGGSINFAGTGTLAITANDGNRIANGALVNGGLNLNTSGARVRLQSFANFTGAATLSSSNNTLAYEYSATLGNQTIHMDGPGANLSIEGASTLSIGPFGVVRGRGTIGDQLFVMGNNALVNSGRITADAMSGSLDVRASTFVNNGTLQASSGTLNITSANWSTTFFGALHVGGSGVINLGGTLTGENLTNNVTRAGGGGRINITGTVNNAGNILDLTTATGEFTLVGGVINDGTITQNGNGRLGFSANANNRLANGAMLDGDLVMDQSGARARLLSGANFIGSATLSGAGAMLAYEYAATADLQTINLEDAGAAVTIADGATLTLGADGVIRGRGLAGNPALATPNGIVNHGRIAADLAGQTLSVHPSDVTNTGILEAVNAGSLSLRNVNNTTGQFRATGGGSVVVAALSGNLNDSTADGSGSVLDVSGSAYAINENLTLDNDAVLYLRGGWVKSSTMTIDARAIFDYASGGPSPLAALRADVVSGFAGGAWNGPGINSARAAGSANFAVGYADTADLLPAGGTFAGQSVDGSAVLAALTRAGDANLDFVVNLADFNRLAANFGGTDKLWTDGDFDYNGLVNLQDFNRLAANFGLSAAGPHVTPQDWARLGAAIPEPGALGAMIAACSGSMLRRRRRGA
jgi:hypothetical protein